MDPHSRKRISKTELNRYGDYDEYATEKADVSLIQAAAGTFRPIF